MNPFRIILRNIVELMLLPINIPLYLFFGSTVAQLYGSLDVSSTIFCALLLLQYVITTVVLGLFLGVTIGLTLSSLHKLFPIPDVYWDLSFKLPNIAVWKKGKNLQETSKDEGSPHLSSKSSARLQMNMIEPNDETLRSFRRPDHTTIGNLTPESTIREEESEDEASELTQLWDRDYIYDTIRTETNDDLQILINRLRNRKMNRDSLDE